MFDKPGASRCDLIDLIVLGEGSFLTKVILAQIQNEAPCRLPPPRPRWQLHPLR